MAKRTSTRTASDVIGALLAAQTGVMAGEQEAQQRDLEQQALAQRQKMAEQDQLMQMFNTGARLEEQALQNELAPLETAFRLPGQTPQSQQALGQALLGKMQGQQRNFTPDALNQTFQSGRLPQFKPVQRQLGEASPMPTPQFLDPKQESAKKALAMRLSRTQQQVFQTSPEVAAQLDGIISGLEAGEIELADAHKLAGPIIADVETKFGLQQKADEDYRKSQLEESKARREALQADRDRQEANRLRDDKRDEEARATTAATGLLTRFHAARGDGNIEEIGLVARQHQQLAKRFPGIIAPLDPRLDPDLQAGETDELAKARVEETLAKYAANPKDVKAQTQKALGHLYGTFKGARWNQLDEATQSKIIDRIGALEAEADLPNTLPAHLKTKKLTPQQEEQNRRWDLDYKIRKQKADDAHAKSLRYLEHIDRRIKIADQQVKGTYAPSRGVKYSSGELALVKQESEKLKSLRMEYAAALKNPEQSPYTIGRLQKLIGEQEQKLDATIKQPAAAVNGALWNPAEQQAIDILTRTNKPGTNRPFTLEEAQNRVRNKRGR